MWKNLKIEWLKIRSYRTFWVLLVLFIISLIGINYMTYQFKVSMKAPKMADAIIGNPFGFPDVWQTVTYLCSYILFLPGLLMVILITNEYNFKTHRQNIIDGLSRFQFVFVKIIMAILLALLATIIAAIIAIITGYIAATSFSSENIIYLLYFLLQAITYTLTGCLFGFLLKRSGIAIALFFLYVMFIKNLLSLILNKYLDGVGNYFPVKSSDNLIPMPFLHSITKQYFDAPNIPLLLSFSIVYLVAFYFIIIKKYTTQDL
ncbi:ABC transporter permease [Arachidicoccus sp.]|uniref:ABC transporter permease n=1 Tax=Arachidicoccus sp. TaxID=1872624 RepID=UPI003D25A868